MIQRAAILGTGSWGTALATLLATQLDEVCLIGRNKKTIHEINHHHSNQHYLPDQPLPTNIIASTELSKAADYPLILFVIPTSAIEETAKKLADLSIPQETILVSCSKGLLNASAPPPFDNTQAPTPSTQEAPSFLRMSEVIKKQLPNNPIAVLSGPNHAEEVCKGLATCAVIGSHDAQIAKQLQKLFNQPFFRCYTSDDMAGIELGGALKNTFAIAAGIAEGLGLGDNAIAALVTRGLAEMMRLGTAMGGKMETFVGLSGVGDLMATCYSPHSRNNRVGKALGKGGKLKDIIDNLGMVAEGVVNTQAIYQAALNAQVRTPLINAVYQTLYQNKSASEAMEELLTRDTRAETE